MPTRPAPYEFPASALQDSVEFAHTFLLDRNGNPLRLHDGQIELLHGIQRYTIVAAGRQWGKSTDMSAYATFFGATKPNRQIWVIAPSLEQARIIFDEIIYHFSHPPLSYLVKGKIKEYPFPQIDLKNGTQFHARGANSPQYIRGNRSHLTIIDEAAHMKDKVITDAIEPMMTVTGQEPGSAQIMISTPFGRGAFYDAYAAAEQGRRGVSFHYTSLDNPYADHANLELLKNLYGESSFLWQTEYMAQFLDDDMSVFPWKDVEWAYENYPHTDRGRIQFPYGPEAGHRYLQGVDLANQRDFFVSALLDGTDQSAGTLVRYDRWQRRGYTAAKRTIRENYSRYNHARTLIDATTLAESVVEDLADIHAEGYKFTGSAAKYDIVQELSRSFSEHRLRIPQDQNLLDELRYFAYSITPSKVLRIEASQGHDDTVMALALANHIFIERRGTIYVMGVGSPDSFIRRAGPRLPQHPQAGEWVDPIAAAFKD